MSVPSRSPRRMAIVAAVGALALGAAGCGSSDDTASSAASAEYCAALAATVAEGEALATIVAGEPAADEIAAQHDKLKAAYGTIGETGDDSEGALKETVTRAFDEFETAISQLPSDIPASELAVAYREQTGTLLDSLGEVQSEAGC